MADAVENYEVNIKVPAWLKPLPFNGYTIKNFESWDDDIKVELLNGIPYMMAPPSIKHQEIFNQLFGQLLGFLKGKPCRVFSGVGVRLFPEKDKKDKNGLIPDLVVVCDEKKLNMDPMWIMGPPEFIIEILSPNDRGRDLVDKKELYEKAGVKEYWVIDQVKHHRLYRYVLIAGVNGEGIYAETVFDLARETKIPVSVLPGCVLEITSERSY